MRTDMRAGLRNLKKKAEASRRSGMTDAGPGGEPRQDMNQLIDAMLDKLDEEAPAV
jgi:hypothetical protein